jgi:hypothetical protein
MNSGGLDPEPTGKGAQSYAGNMDGNIQARQLTVGATVPPSRYFIFGLNIKF